MNRAKDKNSSRVIASGTLDVRTPYTCSLSLFHLAQQMAERLGQDPDSAVFFLITAAVLGDKYVENVSLEEHIEVVKTAWECIGKDPEWLRLAQALRRVPNPTAN